MNKIITFSLFDQKNETTATSTVRLDAAKGFIAVKLELLN